MCCSGEGNQYLHSKDRPSPLLLLPAELRLEIYKHALTFSHSLRLQDQATKQSVSPIDLAVRRNAAKAKTACICRKQHWLSDQSCTALFRTCRTIYDEAIEIFYENNTFHFPALLNGIAPILTNNISSWLIQRASLDFSYTVTYLWSRSVGPHVDPTIAQCIQQLMNACPTLKSLTLHIPSIPALVQLIGLGRNAESATIHVLSSLKQSINRLSIVGRGDYSAFTALDPLSPHAPMGLCTMIAPRDEWVATPFKEWPYITVRDEDFCEENCYRIRHSRNVAVGFVTTTTKSIWEFQWERSRVGCEEEERVGQEDEMASEVFATRYHAELWGW